MGTKQMLEEKKEEKGNIERDKQKYRKRKRDSVKRKEKIRRKGRIVVPLN